MNKKLIFATIGPSSMNKETIQKMDKSGVDIFRINLSHTEACNFKKIINKISRWTSKPICPDTEGAQLRTGKLNHDKLIVKPNSIIELVGSDFDLTDSVIPLNVSSPEIIFTVGDLVKIDFEQVLIQIIEIKGEKVIARVLTGGIIRSNKGISVDRHIGLPSFTEKDIKVIEISNRLKINTIFLSFCSDGESIMKLRDLFSYDIKIISKIENQAGLKNIDDICIKSDGILIDRGDLSRVIAIEKIAFAQSYIIEKGAFYNTPVYTATNFLESMIENPKPTRAEINDIVSTLSKGGSGIVLAAETAIGKYPVDCVRIISRIIKEFENSKYFLNGSFINQSVEYLLSLSLDGIIKPHGEGELVQQVIDNISYDELESHPSIFINEKYVSDVIQISEGVYTPLTGFMDIAQINLVLTKNELLTGECWTLPIILQVSESELENLPNEGQIILKNSKDCTPIGLLNIQAIEKIKSFKEILVKWFGTDDQKHPGVREIINGGEYIISGETSLFSEYRQKTKKEYEFSPKQTREIFYHNGWYNIIGFHTRNIPHTGHEYIQKKALEISNAEAILLSPVTGKKKAGDFRTNVIIACYQYLINNGAYEPGNALLSAFNTYSRYAGPREAVFTAICRKNFGCNYFIVGRDHTGVGKYYSSDASINIFDTVDLGIEILKFETASYCSKRDLVTTDFNDSIYDKSRIEISGTKIRNLLNVNKEIPSYLLRTELSQILKEAFRQNSREVFDDPSNNKV